MVVNGSPYEGVGKTVMEMVHDLGFREDRIVVEYNGDILPKDSWTEVYLTAADRLEVVTFVGGG